MAIELAVTGVLPPSLSGRYAFIGDGMVHAVGLGEGRAPSYRNHLTTTAATTLVWFGGTLLTFSHGQLARELGSGAPVDLAGGRRALAGYPALDPVTGELHLLTFGIDPAQLHVRVSPGGLTRTVRSIDGAASRIQQITLTRDHGVLLAHGFVGLIERTGYDARATWFPIDTSASDIAAADDDGKTVVAYATTPSLERWKLDRRATSVHREVLDATPQPFSTHSCRSEREPRRFLWTVGSGAVHKHDLLGGARESHDFSVGYLPGELVFVADPDRSTRDDGGWLLGFVHDETNLETDFVVLDAHVVERPAVAVVHIPRCISIAGHGTWIPTVGI